MYNHLKEYFNHINHMELMFPFDSHVINNFKTNHFNSFMALVN